MMRLKFLMSLVVLCAALGMSSPTAADVVLFDFEGNAGIGLLPDNEVGDMTSVGSGSPAIGGETGIGIAFDTSSSLLLINFEFEGLTDGLFFDAASGIHLHEVTDPSDPFNSTGPIVFNLNNFADANVVNFTPQIADGATSGEVTAVVDFSGFESSLLAGNFYLNIHSAAFTGGELRANLVVVPEPATMSILAAVGSLTLMRRRRR